MTKLEGVIAAARLAARARIMSRMPAGPVLDRLRATMAAPGMRFGRYRLVEPFGAGGIGEVSRAPDTSLGGDVASLWTTARARRIARVDLYLCVSSGQRD